MSIRLVDAYFCVNCETIFEKEQNVPNNNRTNVSCPRCSSTVAIPLSKWLMPSQIVPFISEDVSTTAPVIVRVL